MSKDKERINLVTFQIRHPTNPKIKAIVNVWFMPDGEIVLGGHGWYEYCDYEELHKKDHKELKA